MENSNIAIKQIKFGDEIYYLSRDGVFNSGFEKVEQELTVQIIKNYFINFDYSGIYLEEEIVDFALLMKRQNMLYETIEFINNILRNKNYILIKRLLPILTSSYRMIEKPNKAIEVYSFYKNYIVESKAILISVGAAYYDLNDRNKAKKFADTAYARYGKSKELSNFYKRLESGEQNRNDK